MSQPTFSIGDTVIFTDEYNKERESVVTRIVPKGEYAADEIAYALKGEWGGYVRTADELKSVERTEL